MDESTVVQYITKAFQGVDSVAASGDYFFFYDPDRQIPHDRRFPFATLVTGDNYDKVSDLKRDGVFRLNIGVRRETYAAMFGPPPGPAGPSRVDHDFTALDTVMPHPVYAPQSWVCVLNPSEKTFQDVVVPLLTEAYKQAAGRHARRAGK